ncbi:MAG: AI-2E family transporter [Methylocystis sp.]|uniref:AI-2E family transporter n=1 Tax=Methylocystis sp. TaxID=1911079 RepID=UPI003DA27EA6
MRDTEDTALLALILAVSVAFAWILWPFYGAVLWGTVTAIVFAPLYRRLLSSMQPRRNLAAIVTVMIIVLVVILPLALIAVSMAQEASGVYEQLQSGDLDLVRLFRQVFEALPAWAADLMRRFGLASLGEAQEKLSAEVIKGSQFFATKALGIGQSAVSLTVNLCVMLYLLFFLLRDEEALAHEIRDAIPLRAEQKDALLRKFAVVIRATVKGDLLVAVLQGALGGLIFWILGVSAPLLWAALMAILSLVPAIGAALVWGPVAIYFLASGAIWQGIVLIVYGAFVIGLADNVLRPILVGKDTKMPNYVVLISTLGGIQMFGLNGFVMGPVIAAIFIAAWDIYSITRQGTHWELELQGKADEVGAAVQDAVGATKELNAD